LAKWKVARYRVEVIKGGYGSVVGERNREKENNPPRKTGRMICMNTIDVIFIIETSKNKKGPERV
jgi:hypothetical protein